MSSVIFRHRLEVCKRASATSKREPETLRQGWAPSKRSLASNKRHWGRNKPCSESNKLDRRLRRRRRFEYFWTRHSGTVRLSPSNKFAFFLRSLQRLSRRSFLPGLVSLRYIHTLQLLPSGDGGRSGCVFFSP